MAYFKQYYKGVSIENKDGIYFVNGLQSTCILEQEIKKLIDKRIVENDKRVRTIPSFYKGQRIEETNDNIEDRFFFINGAQTSFGTLQHCHEYIDKHESL